MNQPLHHWYHVYADGDYVTQVAEHFNVLRCYGLQDALATINVGFVGCSDHIEQAKGLVMELCSNVTVIAESPSGWEQETLVPMWEFAQHNDGYASYAHTKGASRQDPIDSPWRRDMTWHNFVQWQHVVNLLDLGKSIVGCHWIAGGPASNPANGTGGMFGGNFWWTRLDLLRQNVPPQMNSRYSAEHWIGQLSECIPITDETVLDLSPGPIAIGQLKTDW